MCLISSFSLFPQLAGALTMKGTRARRNLKPKIVLLNQLIIRICDRNRYPRFLFSVSPHFRFNPISFLNCFTVFVILQNHNGHVVVDCVTPLVSHITRGRIGTNQQQGEPDHLYFTIQITEIYVLYNYVRCQQQASLDYRQKPNLLK